MIETPAEVPEELVPTDDLYVSLGGGKEVALRCYRAQLHGCPERPAIGLDRAYSARPLVLVEKQAMFPELAVLSFFRKKGWEGVWVDAAHRKYFDRMPNQSKGISLGAHAAQVLARVAQYAGSGRAGCWDLVLWADRAVAFAAVVGDGDSPASVATTAAVGRLLGEARTGWLRAAVKSGMTAAQFAVVRWEYRKVAARRKRA